MSKRNNSAKAKLKAATQEERIHMWKQLFKNLLGKPPKIMDESTLKIMSNQLDTKLGQFTQEKLNLVLRTKNRKDAGLDEILPEVWKTR